ncbi:unnamed protein product [Dovyalis caffra]|uniref:Uncharacterized protein n=1 Tax=Dovyalis caffra TaxID=77055 RepID=A0AAV1R460_9ROSI|nr:unnamed protein product [Dovyalis caffra]
MEEINKDDYPEEVKEQGAAALILSCLTHTRVTYKTGLALDKLKSSIFGSEKKHQNSYSSRKRSSVTDDQEVLRRNDQEGEDNNNAAARNLPGQPPLLSLEQTLGLIDNYDPPKVPSIPGLTGLIGKCSSPFEKQLTESDLRDDQSRLSINKADAKDYLYPLLNDDENLADGIKVTTYDPNGKEFEMVIIMGKYSIKKKRAKYSSQGRARKRKDTRRSKSKKLRRRDDSESYSDVDSRSSLSVSSFDSEDSYRIRRARARSLSTEESPHLRKRKGSKRNDERKKTHEKKTKKRRKKKARRDSSVSETWSCSTCQSPSSQSDVSEYKRHKGRPDRREDEKRKLANIRSGDKRRRYGSGSCSSCSRHDGNNDFLTSDAIIGENTSKRLRSVIILPGQDNEVRELDKNEYKEEITYDHYDYPSSRSNDSNEGLNNMEKRPIEDEKIKDDAAFNIEAVELTESEKVGEGQLTRNKLGYDIDKVGTNDTKKEKNEASRVTVDSVNGDDLETILRQRALENLKSFRSGLGGFQRNAQSAVIQKDKFDGTVKAPSPSMPELGQIKSPTKGDGARMVREDYAHSSQNEKITDGEICGSESSSAKNNVHLPDQVAIPGRDKVSTIASSSKNKPRLVTSALRQALSNASTTLKETPASQEETPASREANQAKLVGGISIGKSATLKETPASLEANQAKLVSGSNVGKNATDGAHTVTSPPGNDNDDKASVSAPAEPSSCLTSAAGDVSLNKSQDEGKEGSQLEQKTMSVMRGGEMVQVNYKVYIPKKTPPLARRQLKR